MLTAGCLRYSATGRVLIDLTHPPVSFNGGTPIAPSGGVSTSVDDPEVYLSGFGYKVAGTICAREAIPNGFLEGGSARAGVGSLALALTEPITGYIAGVPVVEDGRVAVEYVNPPPNLHAFDGGFEQPAFS